eukprot:scaffold5504_cov101-Isochrysis_galbana.AAC.8
MQKRSHPSLALPDAALLESWAPGRQSRPRIRRHSPIFRTGRGELPEPKGLISGRRDRGAPVRAGSQVQDASTVPCQLSDRY